MGTHERDGNSQDQYDERICRCPYHKSDKHAGGQYIGACVAEEIMDHGTCKECEDGECAPQKRMKNYLGKTFNPKNNRKGLFGMGRKYRTTDTGTIAEPPRGERHEYCVYPLSGGKIQECWVKFPNRKDRWVRWDDVPDILPAGWKKYNKKRQSDGTTVACKPYYYNKKTRKSQWKNPSDDLRRRLAQITRTSLGRLADIVDEYVSE